MADEEGLAVEEREGEEVPPTVWPVQVIDINACEPDEDNPNEQNLQVFNALVEGIKKDGFLEPLLVVPLGNDKYRIVGGEHRWRAGLAAGLSEVTAAIVDPDIWDADMRKVKMVRMNAVRGNLDPEKFTKLWERLKRRYEPDTLQQMLGFGGRDTALNKLIKDMRRSLPPGARSELDRRKDKISSIGDLVAVVQSLFTRYGDTVPYHFILFAFGEKTHLMVRAEDETFQPVANLADWCAMYRVKLDEVLARLTGDELVRLDALDDEALEQEVRALGGTTEQGEEDESDLVWLDEEDILSEDGVLSNGDSAEGAALEEVSVE